MIPGNIPRGTKCASISACLIEDIVVMLGILYFTDWTGLVKRGLVKLGLEKRGLVKRRLVKRIKINFINTIIYYSKNFLSENKMYHNS